MKTELITLESGAELQAIVVDDYYDKTRPAMLIMPGGAYEIVCKSYEGTAVALAYLNAGYQCFILDYSVKEKALYPAPLYDAVEALLYIRRHAEEYFVDPRFINVIGFSAGGHLAAMLATCSTDQKIQEKFHCTQKDLSLSAAVLGYPVLSPFGQTHQRTFENILGKSFDRMTKEEMTSVDVLSRVDEYTAPFFLWHTVEDAAVPVINTIRLAEVLTQTGHLFEMHLYPHGYHGLSLANKQTRPEVTYPEVSEWFPASVTFIDKICHR